MIAKGFSEAFSDLKVKEDIPSIERNPIFILLKKSFYQKLNLTEENVEEENDREFK